MANNLELKSSSINKEENPHIRLNNDNSIDTSSYHREELVMNKAIIINAIIMIWFGIVTIIGCTVLYILGFTSNLFVTFTGVFIDLFSATILYLVNNSTKTKNEYFKVSAKVESEKRLIALIQTFEDEKFKQKEVDKLVDNHCHNK